MSKHAYLIMAHNNFYVLEKLLLLLDDERNDIYLHIDAKVKSFDFDYYKSIVKKANLNYTRKRKKVYWGTRSQVKTELLLYEESYLKYNYKYYHLISGVDLPIKTQDYIHEYLSNSNKDYIFYHDEPSVYDINRISKYHLNINNKNMTYDKFNNLVNIFQSLLKINRLKNTNLVIKRGYNWATLTSDAVKLILDKKKEILRLTFMSLCADELYKQIILLNFNLKSNIYNDENGNRDDLRLVDWNRKVKDSPYIWRIEDFELIRNSRKLFARKFNDEIDKEIVDKVFKYVKNKQEKGEFV